jgi:hypothetical protein
MANAEKNAARAAAMKVKREEKKKQAEADAKAAAAKTCAQGAIERLEQGRKDPEWELQFGDQG